MKRKLFFIFIMLFLCKINASAVTYAGCDTSIVARMKQLVTNVNISYNYRIVNDEVVYDLVVSNLTNNMYVSDNYFGRDYYGFQNGELVIYGIKSDSITLRFYSNIAECRGLLLGTKYEQFPIFNKYWDDDICSDMQGIYYCSKWTTKSYTKEEIEKAIKDYKNSIKEEPVEPTKVIYKKSFMDKLIEFYVKYYYIALLGVIGICVTIIVINKRKNQFKI